MTALTKKAGANSSSPEELAVPAQLVAPLVLLLTTRTLSDTQLSSMVNISFT